jgi:O-antigen ligase
MITKASRPGLLGEQATGRGSFWVLTLTLGGLVVGVALLLGFLLGRLDSFTGLGILSLLLFALVLVCRQYELAAVLMIGVHLYLDWYLGMRFAGLAITLLLLAILFMARSPERPCVWPRMPLLWLPLLALAIFPADRGLTLSDGFTYYLTVFFAAWVTFWLGSVLARDQSRLRLALQLLAGFGVLIALHALFQSLTGTFLFYSDRYNQYLSGVSNYELFAASTVYRAGSFFVNPDWSGAFFATILFVPLGLFFTSSSLLAKVLHLIEVFLIALALLSTYSTGSWIACMVSLPVFLILLGKLRARVVLFFILLLVAGVILLLFPAQINYQLQHAATTASLSLRVGAWQTALEVIKAFPWTGIGLGLYAYLYRAEPFRVRAQYRPLAHPHDAYLEIGAMSGLPVLVLFLLLLALILWFALRNWARADKATRSLLAGGIAAIVALSANSVSINGWTLAPLTSLGWLILGLISSPLLTKKLRAPIEEESARPADDEQAPTQVLDALEDANTVPLPVPGGLRG